MVAQDCFVHRVGALPLVAAASQAAQLQYEKAKGWNRVVGVGLAAVEKSVQLASAVVQPISQTGPAVSLGVYACQGLDKLEAAVPLVKMTPQQIQAKGTEYYERSYAKKGLDTMKAAKGRVVEAKDSVTTLYSTTTEKARGLVQVGRETLSATLTYSEGLVDTYLVEEEDQQEHDYAAQSSQDRLKGILVKIYSGVQLKASRKVDSSVKFVRVYADQVGDLRKIFNNARVVTVERISRFRTGVTDSKQWIVDKTSGITSEKFVLRLFQGSATIFAVVSGKTLSLLAKNVSPRYSQPLTFVRDQICAADSFLKEAESFGELKENAKDRLKLEENMANTRDYLSSFRPLSWMARPRTESEEQASTEKEEENSNSSEESDSSDEE